MDRGWPAGREVERMLKLFLVFFGGGAGSVLRYGAGLLMNRHMMGSAVTFPWATLAVNVAGSFLIGLFYALSSRFNLSQEARLLLTTGLCGGFTTFSTFSNEVMVLLKQGSYGMSALYAGLSIVLGLAAVLLGSHIVK